jgi:hypothetical protein
MERKLLERQIKHLIDGFGSQLLLHFLYPFGDKRFFLEAKPPDFEGFAPFRGYNPIFSSMIPCQCQNLHSTSRHAFTSSKLKSQPQRLARMVESEAK